MAGSVEEGLKQSKIAREKKQEAEARNQLYRPYMVPKNVSEMNAYVFGKFTVRDILLSGACELLSIALCMPIAAVAPVWVAVILGACLGIPGVVAVNLHTLKGELPIEQRLKIALKERKEKNLLFWDKTKVDGEYIETSTQSFMPKLEFSEDNFIYLDGGEGGFSVIKVSSTDMAQVKDSELLQVVMNYRSMLDRLLTESDEIPIQIYSRSVPNNLADFISQAELDIQQSEMEGKQIKTARACDYKALLMCFDRSVSFHYEYYVVVTYRKDAEDVGNKLKSASVFRENVKEKANPFKKKQQNAASVDFEIGEDRGQKLKDLNRSARFGKTMTKQRLETRTRLVLDAISDLGASRSDVTGKLLDKTEVAKLIHECYNDTDKNVVDAVVGEAIEPRDYILSNLVYEDFPELFTHKEKKKRDKTLKAIQTGHIDSMGGGA